MDADAIAAELVALLGTGGQRPTYTDADPGFDLAGATAAAHRVRALREAAGARVVGRKIGFTNTTIWDVYGVRAPIWGPVYDRTRRDLPAGRGRMSLAGLPEPRIEPEVVLILGRTPEPDMPDAALIDCVAAVAHGFEIVQSVYPGWRFALPDTVAAFALHGALLVGPPEPVTPAARGRWRDMLAGFEVTLARGGAPVARGVARNVLGGGPLAALGHLARALAADPAAPPLMPGERITTGTITDAFPVAPGETWSTRIDGLPLPGLELAFDP